MTNKPTKAIAGKETIKSETDRGMEIMRFICEYKIRHPESRELWFKLEADLMTAIRERDIVNLINVNDTVANIVLDYLLAQERSAGDEHTNRANGEDRFD